MASISLYFILSFLKLITLALCAPVSDDTDSIKKLLQSKKYLVIAHTGDIKMERNNKQDIDNQNIKYKMFRMLNAKPLCPTVRVKDVNEKRIPREIIYEELTDKKDSNKCRPIIRTITYIEKKNHVNQHLGQRLYRLKKMMFVIGYEAMEVWTCFIVRNYLLIN